MTSLLVLPVLWGIAQATCVGVVACLIVGVGRRLAPAHRVAIALAALLLMPALPVFMLLPLDATAAAMRGRIVGMDAERRALATKLSTGGDQDTSIDPATSPTTTDTAGMIAYPDDFARRWWESIDHAGMWLQASADGSQLHAPSTEPPHGIGPGVPWLRLLIWAVLAIIGLGVLRLILGWVQVRRLMDRSRDVNDACLVTLVDELSQQLGLSYRLPCRVTTELTTPAVVGWRRSAILLPGDWQQWTQTQLRSAMAHELAHVRRHDPLCNAAAQAALAISYFHPLAHWLMRRFRLDQELAADRLAAPLAGGRQCYLESLAELALRHTDRQPFGPTLALFSSHRMLIRRLQMLRHLRLQSSRGASALGVLAAGCLLAAAVTAVTIRPAVAQPQEKPQAATVAESKTVDGQDLSAAEIQAVLAALQDYQSQFADETVQLEVDHVEIVEAIDSTDTKQFSEELTASLTKIRVSTWSELIGSDPFGPNPKPNANSVDIRVEIAFDGERGVLLHNDADGNPMSAREICSKPWYPGFSAADIFLFAIGFEPLDVKRVYWHREMTLLKFLASAERVFRTDHPELGRVVVFRFAPSPEREREWYLKESPHTHIVGNSHRYGGKPEWRLRLTYGERDSKWVPIHWVRSLARIEGRHDKSRTWENTLTRVEFLDQAPDGTFQLSVPEGVRYVDPCDPVDSGDIEGSEK